MPIKGARAHLNHVMRMARVLYLMAHSTKPKNLLLPEQDIYDICEEALRARIRFC
jgi:3-methyladenine DNA glycosylase AlkD